jgi:hypothetical protein
MWIGRFPHPAWSGLHPTPIVTAASNGIYLGRDPPTMSASTIGWYGGELLCLLGLGLGGRPLSADCVEKLCNGSAAEILIREKPNYSRNNRCHPLGSNNITQIGSLAGIRRVFQRNRRHPAVSAQTGQRPDTTQTGSLHIGLRNGRFRVTFGRSASPMPVLRPSART